MCKGGCPLDIIKLITEGIQKNERYSDIYSAILNITGDSLDISYVYETFYKNKNPELVFNKIKRNRHRRRILDWYNKVMEGYELYIHQGKEKRGFYQHLVEYEKTLKKIESESSPIVFGDMFSVSDADSEIKRRIEHLRKWKDNKDSFLIEYPFFNKLTKNTRKSVAETDLIMIVGNWILNNFDRIKDVVLYDKIDIVDSADQEVLPVEQTPSIILNDPYFGISGRINYMVDEKDEISQTHENLKILHKKENFELPKEYKLAIDSLSINSDQYKIKSPDMKDKRVFDLLLNFRDKNFQQNRRISAPISDLMKLAYETDGAKSYEEMRNRLIRLGYFRLLKEQENGGFDIRSLFSRMTVDQDSNGKWYVLATASDDVYDSVLRKQFTIIYDRKVKELTNDLAYHLAFIIQKNRMLYYKPELEEIKFEISWEDLSYVIRFNQRSKRKNMDSVGKALKEINEKDFLIKKVERYHPLSFIVTCYTLNNQELEGMNKAKVTFEEPIQDLLSGVD